MRAAVVPGFGQPLVIDAHAEDPAEVLQRHGGADAAIGLAVDGRSFAAALRAGTMGSGGLRRGAGGWLAD